MNIKKQLASIQQSAQTDPRFKQHHEVTVTPEAKDFVNRIFKSLLPHFPAWRQSCPEPEDLGRLKNAWTKAMMRHELKTGKQVNVKAGLLACEESDSDWLPSVGKFIKWCDQSGDLELSAQKALDLFNRCQRQVESVGQMVVSKHAFDLKRLNAPDTKKQFISLFLTYAEDNAIEPLDAFALTETVQLSEEQAKDAKNRAEIGRKDFMAKFLGESEPTSQKQTEKPSIITKSGTTCGRIQTGHKTGQRKQDEIDKQLKAAGIKK